MELTNKGNLMKNHIESWTDDQNYNIYITFLYMGGEEIIKYDKALTLFLEGKNIEDVYPEFDIEPPLTEQLNNYLIEHTINEKTSVFYSFNIDETLARALVEKTTYTEKLKLYFFYKHCEYKGRQMAEEMMPAMQNVTSYVNNENTEKIAHACYVAIADQS